MHEQFALVTTTDDHLHDIKEDDMIVDALRRKGAGARKIIWHETNPASLAGHTVVLRTPWDYQARLSEFIDWLHVVDAVATLLNPLDVIRTTIDKGYLIDMAKAGYAVPETMAMPQTREGWHAALANPLFAHAIAKRRIGAGAIGLRQIYANDDASWEPLLAETHNYILQPFIPEVVSEGELSFLFFGERFSHAMHKRPRAGDIRVQMEWGGSVDVIEPSSRLINQAQEFLNFLPAPTAYARVDVVEVEGRLLLMELEVFEPELFLTYVPEAAEAFAASLLSQ